MSEISREILKKVRRIQITTGRQVNNLMAGQYLSVFKGQGMEFSQVREYVAGDDVRTIDWNVTARMQKPFVKQFVEEREMTVVLLVDVSRSMSFSSFPMLKNEVAAEVSSLLALSAIKNNDKVGLILFSDSVHKFIPPKKGKTHVLRVIREVLATTSEGKSTDLAKAIDFLNKTVRKKSVVFLISDFISFDFQKQLRVCSRRHDLICLSLNDRLESRIPDSGLVNFQDSETGEIVLLDCSDPRVRATFERITHERKKGLEVFFKSSGVDHIFLDTSGDHLDPLLRFFRRREECKRHARF